MKKKNIWITIIIAVVVILLGGFITYKILSNENKLTSGERSWINKNFNTVQNIYVVKDENIFSKDGHGVFYSFLDSFSAEYGLNINVINFDANAQTNNINLTVSDTLNDKAKLFYTDHYVLLSKNLEYFNTNEDLDGLTIGVLNSDLEHLKNYLKEININFNGFETEEELFKAVGSTVNYIILPRMAYLDKILANNLMIVYHLSDINKYYVLNGTDSTLSSIILKYFNIYSEKINDSIKKEELEIFKKGLNISATDMDKLLSVDYKYGFINNSPYEVIMSGTYGGIIAKYLQEFSEFSGVYFDITKYRNIDKLNNALNKNKVDIYFDFNTDLKNNYAKTTNGINSSIAILTKKDNDKIFNSIYGLQGEKVYVEKGSTIESYLKKIGNIELITYDNSKELFKLNKDNVIIAMDKYIFDYYEHTKLNNYTAKYSTYFDDKYCFRIKSEHETLIRLLDRYMNYLDKKEMISKGLSSHNETVKTGSILNNIAKYVIMLILLILVLGLVVYKKGKKIRIAKRLKKDEKIRFIDDLTCLKNRAYLSDFIKTWSNNTIYPQAIIVVDLNRLKEINDKYGVLEGDKQIQAAANALIKTQLDNSDLMRSDGNEFVIYTVGYSKKQIINYIHKLNKELKKLPYDFGAEFGYSIIENNLKTVEDALNEATIDMKSKKTGVNSDK